MNARERILEQLKRYEDDPAFLTERLVLEINEEICRVMDEQDMSRSELARRLGVSRQFITRLLNGNPNLTLLTLVKIATALGARINVKFVSQSPAARREESALALRQPIAARVGEIEQVRSQGKKGSGATLVVRKV